jgi:hypothetical protein
VNKTTNTKAGFPHRPAELVRFRTHLSLGDVLGGYEPDSVLASRSGEVQPVSSSASAPEFSSSGATGAWLSSATSRVPHQVLVIVLLATWWRSAHRTSSQAQQRPLYAVLIARASWTQYLFNVFLPTLIVDWR